MRWEGETPPHPKGDTDQPLHMDDHKDQLYNSLVEITQLLASLKRAMKAASLLHAFVLRTKGLGDSMLGDSML